MNLKVILKDYIDFLESKGVTFPDNYTYKMNNDMFQKMKFILEDVDYNFLLDVIDDFYRDLKTQVEETKGKVCIKFANRIVLGEIIHINYETPDKISSIDIRDKKKESINIKFNLIYSIEEPKRVEEVKKEKELPKIKEEKQIIVDKHKYDELIEPDLLSTRQISIIDKPEYVEDAKPTIKEMLFSKTAIIAVICIALVIGAVVAFNSTYASIKSRNTNDVVCIEGYTNINGECIKTSTLETSSTTTTTTSFINSFGTDIEVISSINKED